MKYYILVAAAFALALAGCANVRVGPEQTVKVGAKTLTLVGLDGFNPDVVKPPNPNLPNVFIVNNAIVLDQEPVRPIHNQGIVIIVWALDKSDSFPYFFADDDAVKLSAGALNPLPSDLSCGVVGERKKSFVCYYTKPEAKRQWKYTIKVKRQAGADPTPVDPWVYQD
jgi:hypothetical protein